MKIRLPIPPLAPLIALQIAHLVLGARREVDLQLKLLIESAASLW